MKIYFSIFFGIFYSSTALAELIGDELTYRTRNKAIRLVLQLTNEERRDRNLRPLKMDRGACRKMAQYHADYGADNHLRGRLSHTNWEERLEKFGLLQRKIRVSENVIWLGAHRGINPQQAIDGWMSSPAHRSELLRPQNKKVGIGVAQDSDGVTYWVQCFLDR